MTLPQSSFETVLYEIIGGIGITQERQCITA
jgi:hypothetical protein